MNRQIFVKIHDEEIDISNVTIILWGGGHFARTMCQKLAFDDPRYVVDTNPGKTGSYMQLYLQDREICNPTILDRLDPKTGFILICNKFHPDEIAKMIGENYPLWNTRFSNITTVFFKYSDVEYMVFHDRSVMERVCASNVLPMIKEYVCNVDGIIDNELGLKPGEYVIWPLPNTSGVAFYIAYEEKKYIVRLPRWDKWSCSFYHKKYILGIKEQINIDKLTVYEDANGYSISLVAEPVNEWNDLSILEEIRSDLKSIHSSSVRVEEAFDIADYLRYEDFIRVMPKVDQELFGKIKQECSNYTPCLCHNDLHCGNVVIYKDKAVLIDFEHLAMGDPISDISKLIMDLLFFRKCSLFTDIDGAGEFFLGKCTHKDIKHLYACVIAHLVKNIILFEEKGEDVSWQISRCEILTEKIAKLLYDTHE